MTPSAEEFLFFYQFKEIVGKKINFSWRKCEMMSPQRWTDRDRWHTRTFLAVHLRLNLKPYCFLLFLLGHHILFHPFTLMIPSPPEICHLHSLTSPANQQSISRSRTQTVVLLTEPECVALPLRSKLIRSLSLVRWVASTAVTMATHDLAAWLVVVDIEAFISEMLASVT